MTKEELEKEAEEYTKNLLKKLGIKEDMLLENQPKYLRQESMNFVALDVENVTDAYLASAEPREKRIAELEHQLTHRNCLDCSNHSSKLRMRTLELEQENAELKEENVQMKEANETLATMNNNMWVELEKKRAESQGITNKLHQLIKAKEIIREFVEWANWQGNSKCPSFKSIQDKAEQFLNSEVEK
jgi:hypothetical protein